MRRDVLSQTVRLLPGLAPSGAGVTREASAGRPAAPAAAGPASLGWCGWLSATVVGRGRRFGAAEQRGQGVPAAGGVTVDVGDGRFDATDQFRVLLGGCDMGFAGGDDFILEAALAQLGDHGQLRVQGRWTPTSCATCATDIPRLYSWTARAR